MWLSEGKTSPTRTKNQCKQTPTIRWIWQATIACGLVVVPPNDKLLHFTLGHPLTGCLSEGMIPGVIRGRACRSQTCLYFKTVAPKREWTRPNNSPRTWWLYHSKHADNIQESQHLTAKLFIETLLANLVDCNPLLNWACGNSKHCLLQAPALRESLHMLVGQNPGTWAAHIP